MRGSFRPCVQKLLVQKGVVHKEYNTHMVLHSLHIPNSQLYVSEPPPEWFGNGPNEVRSLWPTSCSLRKPSRSLCAVVGGRHATKERNP